MVPHVPEPAVLPINTPWPPPYESYLSLRFFPFCATTYREGKAKKKEWRRRNYYSCGMERVAMVGYMVNDGHDGTWGYDQANITGVHLFHDNVHLQYAVKK